MANAPRGDRDGSPLPATRRPPRRYLFVVLALTSALGAAYYTPRVASLLHRRHVASLSPPQLQEHVRKHPADLEARYRLGLTYGRAGRNADAIRELIGVLQRNPLRADVLNDLGALYLLEGRYYECLVTLEGALRVRPNYPVAYANLGRLHVATKMPFTAVRELEHAVRLDPGNVETLCDLGEAYQRTLNYSSARGIYERALKVNPRAVRAHLGLGKTYFNLTDYPRAEEALRAALQLAPEEPGALATLGRLKLENAVSDPELQAARDLLRRVLRADSGDPEAWYDLGRAALKQAKAAQAVEFLQRALQLSPQHPGAALQLSRALRAVGKSREADRVAAAFRRDSLRSREQTRLEEQLYQNPRDWDALARLAVIDLETGQYGLAALRCRQLSEGAPRHPLLPSLLAELARGTRPASGTSGAAGGSSPSSGAPSALGTGADAPAPGAASGAP